MKRNKEKFIFVLMGLILGFALGVSILFWKDSISLTQKVLDKTKQFFVSLFESKEFETPAEEVKVKKKSKKKKKQINAVADSTLILTSQDSLDNYYLSDVPDDTLWLEEYSDMYASLNNNGEEVARDKLIFKKQMDAKIITNTTNSNENNLDSLLIGGKIPKEDKNKLNVEFWESPLNFKGYKKNKNFLILYGIKQFDLVDFKFIKNELYLCYADNYYYLENSSDFKNLIPINNQQLINQLKEK